ncbi:unnamed protein product [Ilex paraguariensis]|uniref:Bidirectional sugar transporter SWEET n=1 Tax=Ilex paraguariensis TaxID=185542 RepID=A0ABC8U3N7_9AQUA
MTIFTDENLAFIFGLIGNNHYFGNVVAFIVLLAPLPTFCKIYKRKSSEGFQSIPYSVMLFSAELMLLYAFLRKNEYMIVSLNGIGCVVEAIYLLMYVIYAPKKTKISTVSLILLLNVGSFGVILLFSLLLVKGHKRVILVGWIGTVINVLAFAAPLGIARQVIRTKSVEYMPFTLSLSLTLMGVVWFFYGFFMKDFFIELRNAFGFLCGIAQMTLYLMYKNTKKDNELSLQQNEAGTAQSV